MTAQLIKGAEVATQIREELNEVIKHIGDEPGANADDSGEDGYEQQVEIGGRLSQPFWLTLIDSQNVLVSSNTKFVVP